MSKQGVISTPTEVTATASQAGTAQDGAAQDGGGPDRPTVVEMAVRYGWMPLIALAATNALGSGEVSSLSQAVDGIQKSFHVSDATVALLPVSLSVVGVFGAIPFGFLADRRRRTFVMAAAMVAWTACMGLNGLAWGFGVLLAFRIGVGFAEASGSAAVSLMGDYYPVARRAAAMGWYSSGAIFGSLIGFVGGGIAVSLGGWRWAFWFWVPLGIGVAAFVATRVEPKRGQQEVDFEAARLAAISGDPIMEASSAAMAFASQLPAPRRVGTIDYRTAGVGAIMRELFRIRSMWWALLSLTVAQCMASALGFWAIPFFKRVDHMNSVTAGLFTGILLPTAIMGVIGGGFVADRLSRRGMLNARIYVVVVGAAVSAVALPIGFASHNRLVTALLLLVGGCSITVPIAPSEALFNDVVVADLRGRAASVRSMVRAVSSVGSLAVGLIADHMGGSSIGHAAGLQHALVLFAPICGVAGMAFFFARRSYGHDLAFVCAETTRMQELARQAPKSVIDLR